MQNIVQKTVIYTGLAAYPISVVYNVIYCKPASIFEMPGAVASSLFLGIWSTPLIWFGLFTLATPLVWAYLKFHKPQDAPTPAATPRSSAVARCDSLNDDDIIDVEATEIPDVPKIAPSTAKRITDKSASRKNLPANKEVKRLPQKPKQITRNPNSIQQEKGR